MTRPFYIRHWKEIEPAEQVRPPMMDEPFGYVGEFAPAANISHLRVAHMRLPPGVRAYPPMALRSLEIFAFVLEGTPDLWLNARTGIAHSLLNNTKRDVRLFTFTEPLGLMTKAHHPVDAEVTEHMKQMGMHWDDAPKRKRGPHDGLTDAMRGKPGPKGARKKTKPDFVAHWRDILDRKAGRYPGSKERHGIDASFGKRARFSRIGVHLEVLKPGRRTSFPHAERDEDEFVFVVSGKVDAWNDGRIAPLNEGDFIGWEAGSGITHVIIDNSDADAVLIVGGEASRAKAQVWYPKHPHRQKEIGEGYWADHPKPKFGPHDGMPDALRAQTKRKTAKKAKTKTKKTAKRKAKKTGR
jgi:uncharacterized cupin superfamily protein